MPTIHNMIPDASSLLATEPSGLAWVLLDHLKSQST